MGCGCGNPSNNIVFNTPVPDRPVTCIYTLEELQATLMNLEATCAPHASVAIVKAAINHKPKCLYDYEVYIRDTILNTTHSC